MTSVPGVFAGGDLGRVPDLVSAPCATVAKPPREFTNICCHNASALLTLIPATFTMSPKRDDISRFAFENE
jgi:hypothetical protein